MNLEAEKFKKNKSKKKMHKEQIHYKARNNGKPSRCKRQTKNSHTIKQIDAVKSMSQKVNMNAYGLTSNITTGKKRNKKRDEGHLSNSDGNKNLAKRKKEAVKPIMQISVQQKNGLDDNTPRVIENNVNVEERTVRVKPRYQLNKKRLESVLTMKAVHKVIPKKRKEPQSLRDKMMTKLRASRFRYLNEILYTNESKQSKIHFKNNIDDFTAYHKGYNQQVMQWPLNPLDVIISSIKNLPRDYIIADFGCGEGRLAVSVPQKVHSFDLVSINENVIACDMAHTPLLMGSVDVAIFCLSLMGTNLKDYITEANRVLKVNGLLKVAEVESRFDKVADFLKLLNKFGFTNISKDFSHDLFYFMDFKKDKDISLGRNALPPIVLKPCIYKKR